MILQRVFQQSAIKTGLESETKDELFEELVDVLAKNWPTRASFPRKNILDALMKREAKMSTGISKGIALPHATVEGLDALVGVLGVSSKGVDYDALDGHPVYLVFMVLTPPKDAELHLQTLQSLAALIEDHEIVSRLASASSSSEAFAVIKDFERDAAM